MWKIKGEIERKKGKEEKCQTPIKNFHYHLNWIKTT